MSNKGTFILEHPHVKAIFDFPVKISPQYGGFSEI